MALKAISKWTLKVYADGVGGIPIDTKWLSSQAKGILIEVMQQVRIGKHTCVMLSALCNKIHGGVLKFSQISENKVM